MLSFHILFIYFLAISLSLVLNLTNPKREVTEINYNALVHKKTPNLK